MAGKNLLIVEDESDIQELLKYTLSKEGYGTSVVSSGEDAIKKLQAEKPDLVLLDLMLPGLDGLEVCKRIKAEPETDGIPAIMLTAKGEESDIVIGLELGADDYIAKPFSPKVLLARIKAVLRRNSKPEPGTEDLLVIHNVSIDPTRHKLKVGSEAIDLTAGEFRMIHYLARKPGRVFSRQQIVDAVRGEDYAVTERAVDVQIVGLRKKLGESAGLIETVRGVGYRFKD